MALSPQKAPKAGDWELLSASTNSLSMLQMQRYRTDSVLSRSTPGSPSALPLMELDGKREGASFVWIQEGPAAPMPRGRKVTQSASQWTFSGQSVDIQ